MKVLGNFWFFWFHADLGKIGNKCRRHFSSCIELKLSCQCNCCKVEVNHDAKVIINSVFNLLLQILILLLQIKLIKWEKYMKTQTFKFTTVSTLCKIIQTSIFHTIIWLIVEIGFASCWHWFLPRLL